MWKISILFWASSWAREPVDKPVTFNSVSYLWACEPVILEKIDLFIKFYCNKISKFFKSLLYM